MRAVVDREAVRRALLNLLRNAIQVAPGSVEVEMLAVGDACAGAAWRDATHDDARLLHSAVLGKRADEDARIGPANLTIFF